MRPYLRAVLRRSRLRDLALLGLAAAHFWAALGIWVTLAAGITFARVLTAVMASAAATHSKAVNTAQRVNNLVTAVGSLTSEQGTFGGFSGANISHSMGSGVAITYNPSSSSNEGGTSSSTSGQIGGAAAHTHSMTHYHTESSALQSDFNDLQSSFADICGRLNTMYAALEAEGIL
jgi:hypothetical protein